jgi:imidazoleglycerol-phosphate dehydratase
VTVVLDGAGTYDVEAQDPFLSHMLETWCRYSGFDLTVRATGDLEHHLIEDIAITCGQAFRAAFAGAPCVRIAYDVVPMDDVLVLCAVDLVDRPYYEGALPIPIYEHWFRSFAMEARINVHLVLMRGRDTHHAVEASFKAFARALRAALAPRATEISTKGVAVTESRQTRVPGPVPTRKRATAGPAQPRKPAHVGPARKRKSAASGAPRRDRDPRSG